MDTQRATSKDLEFFNKYLSEFKDKLSFDTENGYLYDEKKKIWVIQNTKNIYLFVRRITEKYFPNHNITDLEIINWSSLIKKHLPKINLSNNLILTNNKVYDIINKKYINKNNTVTKDYIYIYTPLNIKRIKKL